VEVSQVTSSNIIPQRKTTRIIPVKFHIVSTLQMDRIQWVSEALSPGVKRPRCEAVHSPPSISEVKNDGAMPSFSHVSSCRDE
jgi:hypothetical protein